MARFRKKPVVIEAVRARDMTHDPPLELPEWAQQALDTGTLYLRVDTRIEVNTLEGVMLAEPDDWIIRGIKGELYPCKPDIFLKTYDPVDATETAGPLGS